MDMNRLAAIAAAIAMVNCGIDTDSGADEVDNSSALDGAMGAADAGSGDGSPASGGTPSGESPASTEGSSAMPITEEPYDGPIFAGPTKGSAAALSGDGYTGLVANRDVGTVTVVKLAYASATATPTVAGQQQLSIASDAEPFQVAIAPSDDVGYVIARREQALIRIDNLSGTAAIGARASVGSEPTGLTLSPSGRVAYVANWNEGTVSVVETSGMTLLRTIDLNPALVATGYLGEVDSRPALAHPRALALTNDGDQEDLDETLYVAEYFGQQAVAETPTGDNADGLKVGLIYAITLASGAVKTIPLAPLADMGFPVGDAGTAGCFPNQLQDIAVHDGYAYVVSVCASPRGPINPRTNTAPLMSVVQLSSGMEVQKGGQSFNKLFMDYYDTVAVPDDENRRLPLLANNIAFVPGTTVGYVTAGGADAVFRFEVGPDGAIANVGASTNHFINLLPNGQRPVGMAISAAYKYNALVVSDVGRSAALLDFNTQAVADGPDAPLTLATAAPLAEDSPEEAIRRGKRFFTTGLARWSLLGQAWGACESCHGDGLTDNVTWYFPAGPRQSIAMDGTYASNDADDQRILNWTSVRDEIHDFELNTRNVAGGVGAGVSALSMPPQDSDRIDLGAVGAANLNGSAAAAMDPANPLGFALPPRLNDWNEIDAWARTIRTPRAPRGLDETRVDNGKLLFQQGGCIGCHSGAKWTISQRFYTPSVPNNEALLTTTFAVPADFPTAILPALDPALQVQRFRNADLAVDQIQCVNREVGTFGTAEPEVGIAELRQDMTTKAQGEGDGSNGRGYNVPSLLGVAAGAPYFHAGSARTLEAALSTTFDIHARSLSPNLLTETSPAERKAAVDALVAYLLYIDEDLLPPGIPMAGAAGGQICADESAY